MAEDQSKSGRRKPVQETLMSFTPQPGATPPPPAPQEVQDPDFAIEEIATLNPQQRQALGPAGTPPPPGPKAPGPASSASQAMRMPTRGASMSPQMPRPASGQAARPNSNPSMSPTVGRPASGELPAIPSAPGLAGQKIMVGTRLGQIEITGILGKGGMGQVFRGYHAALDIDVAIKVLPDELSKNDVVRQRFLREARLCVKLDHPNIVRVFNVDEWQGNLYLVMELIEGADAAGMLKDGGRFKFKRALEIGAAAAEALGYAHSQGLVHRDVKPHNILLSGTDGKIKLSDFGLARASTSASHLTMSGQIMGTPHYMSPEQAESKEVTDKSDVYSLGVTIYHMLTGETPFVGDTPISVAVQHIAKEIIFPEYRFAPFPKELVAVLKRMVAKDPTKRCSAKQAAVWMTKLQTIINGDDIVPDSALNKTLAPVVAESEAFRIAAEKRRASDEEAREQAKSMIVTMREQAPPVMPTMREQAAMTPQPASQTGMASTPQIVVESSKSSGGLIAVVVVMALVIGGGGAFIYMQSQNANKPANNTVIAGDAGDGVKKDAGKDTGKVVNDGGKDATKDASKDAVRDGAKDATKDGGRDVPKDGGPMLPVDSAALTAKLADFDKRMLAAATVAEMNVLQPMIDELEGLRKEGSAKQVTELDAKLKAYGEKLADLKKKEPPPASKDSEVFAAKLTEFTTKLNSAATATEIKGLKPLMDELDNLRKEASADQRKEHDARLLAYESRLIEVQGTDLINSLNKEVAAFESFPDETRLTNAVGFRDKLEKLVQPEAVREQQKQSREDAYKRLETALQSYCDQLVRKAVSLADEQKWKEADDQFAAIEKLPFSVAQKKAANAQREEVAFMAQLSGAREQIKAKAYRECDTMIRRAEETGYPATLKDKLDALRTDLVKAMGDDMGTNILQSRALVSSQKFKDAEELLNKTVKDMPLTTDQLRDVGTALTFVLMSAPLYEAGQAVSKGLFTEADKSLKDADKIVERQTADNKEWQLDPKQLQELKDLKAEFVTKRDKRFGELLSDAQIAVDNKDFNKAAALISDADKLPRTADQDGKLAQFKNDNQAALRNYLQKLIDDADKAVKAERFNDASDAIKAAASIPQPDDLKNELGRVTALFTDTLAQRYTAMHKKATDAYEAGRFDESRATLDDMLKLPVDADQAKRTSDLELRYVGALDGALVKLLTDARDFLKKEKYSDADAKLTLAAKLPLTSDLTKKLDAARDDRDIAVETSFAAKLATADKYRQDNNFDEAEKDLKAAAALPLSSAQQKRLTEARTAVTQTRDKHIESLFKKLEECVSKGDEAGGQLVKLAIQKFTLTSAQQQRLANLDERLTGAPRSEKVKSLPPKLTAFSEDPVLRTEQAFKLEGEVEALFATNDGKYAAMGTRQGDVYFYNLRRGTLIGKSSGGRRVISSISVSGDGRWGVSCGEDGALVVFDLSGSRVTIGDVQKPRETVVAVAFSWDSKTIFGLSRDGTLYRINPETRKAVGEHKVGVRDCAALAVDSTGQLIAAGGEGGKIAVLDATRFILKRPDPIRVTGDRRIMSLCFSRDGKRLLAASENEGVGVWDVADLDERPRTQYKGLQGGQAQGCGFSNDGKRVCALDKDRRMMVWDTDKNTELKKVEYDALKMERDFRPAAAFIGPAGTMLVGTREGLVVQFTVMDQK
ncbi:MAG: protein kinase [Planctomycetes bacterium]|nr:protein kinase [Planctomycetota bacterium]